MQGIARSQRLLRTKNPMESDLSRQTSTEPNPDKLIKFLSAAERLTSSKPDNSLFLNHSLLAFFTWRAE
jgi:hypothetical protein